MKGDEKLDALIGVFIMFWAGYLYGASHNIVLGVIVWCGLGFLYQIYPFLPFKHKHKQNNYKGG
ncbi:hypothetical protein LCGC14_0652260 [marine sediment metagenome]|uniref:Uncharacterized protein n=1 Tax=marine sediment metagenome TaxID=412755 RepID=A0A0F9U4G7_9ZZZZ